MDEELTPGRGAGDGAADAAAAGPAAEGAPGSAGGWGRLEDALGTPGSWRTDEGGQRAATPTDEQAAVAQAEDAAASLVDLTTAAVASLRSATTGCRLDGLAACRLSTQDVLAGFADIGEARARLDVAEQVLLAEVLSRGLAQEAGFQVNDYVRQALGRRAPLPEVSAVSAAVQVARATAQGSAGTLTGGSRDVVPGAECVRDAVFATGLTVGRAAQIVRFAKDLAPVADDADLAEWVAGFVTAASDAVPVADDNDNVGAAVGERAPDAPGAGRGADARELTRGLHQARQIVKPAKDLEDDERRRRQARAFTRTDGGLSATGMATYKLILDPEGAAIVDTAVSSLSAPRRLEDGTLEPGETTDPRSAATRRADALLDLVHRAIAAGGGTASDSTGAHHDAGSPGSPGSTTSSSGASDGPASGQPASEATSEPTSEPASEPATVGPLPGLGDKAQVLVTIDLLSLMGMLDRAGITSTGEVLSAATVRRLACEAGIIPAVLGSHGQVLDLGRTRRLFTPGQRLVVWRRDKHCSYPGCTVPATWCDVHHVDWWSRGGPTDLTNAALLCRRHHTHVHTHDLSGTVTARGVRWHPSPPARPPTPPPRR